LFSVFIISFGEKNIRAFIPKKLAALTADFSVLPKPIHKPIVAFLRLKIQYDVYH